MTRLKNFINALHVSTKRNYIGRMSDDKIKCMEVASKFEKDYWDGNRRYGYGGYIYIPGRWKKVAEEMIKEYKLNSKSKVLDVGCGKGYLLFELKLLIPEIEIKGIDISNYGIENAKPEVKKYISKYDAGKEFPFGDNEFDLLISINTFHNLEINELKSAIQESSRVSKNSYIAVESYKNCEELFNLQCWALTCKSFYSYNEWIWLFNEFNYDGDYEFIYFN